MLNLTVSGDREVIERFERTPPAVLAILGATARQQAQNLAGYIKTEKLSGQVLRRVSGSLSASIKASDAVQSGSEVRARVFSSGDNKIAKIWELTGSKAHDVVALNGKALAFKVNGQTIFRKKVRIPAQAARPFMRPSLAENAAEISRALKEAAIEGLKQVMTR